MPYYSTVDERYAGGSLQYSAGYFDASNLLNGVFVIAESSVYNSTAYGLLADYYTTADIDVYSLGVLDTGYYTIDVDDYTWDFANYDYFSISNFQILDGAGYIVDTSYSMFTDINLTVTSSQTYYLKITGPSYGEAQYSAQYTKTGELTAFTNYPAISSLYVDGNASVGEVLSVAGTYSDINGIPSAGLISSIIWYRVNVDGIHTAIANETGANYTLISEDGGFYVGYSYAFIDSDGFTEIFNAVLTTQLIEDVKDAVIHTTDDMLLDNLTLHYYKDGTDTGVSTLVEQGGIKIDTSVDFDSVQLSIDTAYQGDLNIIDMYDVIGNIGQTIDTYQEHAADTNNDGVINIIDMYSVLVDIGQTSQTFDLVDQNGNLVTTLDTNSIDIASWTIVANGDVDMSGGFENAYVIAVDIV